MKPQLIFIGKAVTKLILLTLSMTLIACVSSESRQLAPHINLSPETITLASNQTTAKQAAKVDFGLTSTVNESDSLSNIAILPGVRVRSVSPGGPSDIAGIKSGDIILAIDDTPTNHPDALIALSQNQAKTEAYRFEVRRDTLVFEASVLAEKIVNSAPPEELYRADPVASRAGYRTTTVSTSNRGELTGARIVKLFDESPLPTHDIQLNDTIIALNGQPVSSAQHLINSLNNDYELGTNVELTLVRNELLINRKLKLWDPGTKISKFSFLPFWRYEASIDPDKTKFNVIDLWIFSLFSRTREGQETDYSIIGLIQFSTGQEGELVEEND